MIYLYFDRLNRKPEDDDEAMEDDDDDDLEMEEVDSDEWAEGNEGEPIPIEDCLFCPHHSKDLEKNLIHMTEKHSFFVPDLEFVIDLETLISYLGEKVFNNYIHSECRLRETL